MYTRAKKNGRKVMAGGENNIDAACCPPRCGQVAQVDRFVADVVEKDTIHIHQRSLVVQTVMARYYQMWHLLWSVYHHSAHRQPHLPPRSPTELPRLSQCDSLLYRLCLTPSCESPDRDCPQPHTWAAHRGLPRCRRQPPSPCLWLPQAAIWRHRLSTHCPL